MRASPLLKLLIPVLGIASQCIACSIVDTASPTRIGTSFRVRAQDGQAPVPGLPVIADSGDGGSRRAITDKQGMAFFHDVPPGRYHVHADHDAGFPHSVPVEVSPREPAMVTVPLKWPSQKPVTVRSIGGILHINNHVGPGQPVLSVEVLEGRSGRKLKSSHSDESGAFDAGPVAPGLYFLNLEGSPRWGQISGLILVAVDPAAKRETLDMELTWSSCGLSYVDRTDCDRRDVQIGKAGGYVSDASGASFANANIFLLDSRGVVVQQTRTDIRGDFKLAEAPSGTYELLVQSTGFISSRSGVQIKGEDAVPAPSRLHVRLEFGRCSVARND